MRVLVTWGSRRGGTEGIARIVSETLQREGHQAEILPPSQAARASGFEAAVVGGALYANRWHPAARHFVARHEKALRAVPVWFFSSGPLDDSAARGSIPPTRQVEILMERVGALGHVTFGGRLVPDAHGFPAAAMAKKRAGDWRAPDRIQAWAAEIGRALPAARPGVAINHPGRSLGRLLLYGVVGWAICAATMGALIATVGLGVALWLHALAATLIFVLVARAYFRARGAREPLSVAAVFAATVGLLDLVVVAGAIQHSLAMFASFVGTWLPFSLIFGATWATGEVMSMMPARDGAQTATASPRGAHSLGSRS
jgi:menaquinone-dependent protoporphyrinogen oxidase